MAEEYLRFLNLLKALDGPLHRELDSGCTKLLETICIQAYLHGHYYNVNELISMRALGSQASIHKRLHSLVERGYIELEVQEDARVKKVIPTKEAKKRMSQVNKLMLSIINQKV